MDLLGSKNREFEKCIMDMRSVMFDIDCQEPIRLLLKLVANLMLNPGEEKFRTVKVSNKTIAAQIARYANFMDFLKVCGFEQDSSPEILILKKENENAKVIESGMRILKRVANEIQLSPVLIPEVDHYVKGKSEKPVTSVNAEGFDHFKSNTLSMNDLPVKANGNSILEDKVTELKEERIRIMKEAGIPARGLKVYPVIKNFNPRNFKDIEQELDEQALEKLDKGIIQEANRKIMENNQKNKSFRTKAMREMDSLQNKKLYTKVVLRVHLPNRWTIEANFSPLETLKDVIDLVNKEVFLQNPGDVHLFTTPPKTVFADEDYGKTLEDLNLLPASLIHLGFGEVDVKGKVITPSVFDYESQIRKNLIVEGQILKKSIVPKADPKPKDNKKRKTNNAKKEKKLFGILKL